MIWMFIKVSSILYSKDKVVIDVTYSTEDDCNNNYQIVDSINFSF